jgi:hypothetical protein
VDDSSSLDLDALDGTDALAVAAILAATLTLAFLLPRALGRADPAAPGVPRTLAIGLALAAAFSLALVW